jgi:hypothetical protein
VRVSVETSMLSAKAAPVSLRSSVQWQRQFRTDGVVHEMRLRPQRHDDWGIFAELW